MPKDIPPISNPYSLSSFFKSEHPYLHLLHYIDLKLYNISARLSRISRLSYSIAESFHNKIVRKAEKRVNKGSSQ